MLLRIHNFITSHISDTFHKSYSISDLQTPSTGFSPSHQTKIPYAQLDSILRTLGGMQFTGYEEWAKVIAINKFFEGLREQYIEVTQKAYDVATRHQMLMDAMGLNTPVPQQ